MEIFRPAMLKAEWLVICVVLATIAYAVTACRLPLLARAGNDEEFVGPFPSWANLKLRYAAKGDGTADDTAALQRALEDLGAVEKPDVLYLPAGVYRITDTLRLRNRQNVSVLGAGADKTVLRWAGPQGGTMMVMSGVTRSRWGRITWDGAGTAGAGVAHQWDRNGGYAPSNLEHADEVFQNLGKGIIGGRFGGANDAEVTIIRNKFRNCSIAGISIENFNALNYWIWDSQFINNARGVTNEFGAGNFIVYRSLFQNSSVTDLGIGNTGFFSFRYNTSSGSAQFLRAAPVGANSARITVQGNKILDTTNPVAISVGNVGPLILIDNVIRSSPSASGPAVSLSVDQPGDLISIGNTYTVTKPSSLHTPFPRLYTQDDQVIAYSQVNGSLPTMPAMLPDLNRKVFDVPLGADALTIQSAINQASQLTGKRPVVHVPKGSYSINQTISVPAGSDVQIVGDGQGTNFSWSGPSGGNVFQLNGPSKATLREMSIYAAKANAIEIGDPDQPGSRVHIEGVTQEHARRNNFLAENLQYTNVDLISHQMSHEAGSSLKVVGNGGTGSSRVAVWCGANGVDLAGDMAMYEVTNGGALLVEDTWFEGPASHWLHLTDSGTFTFNGGQVSPKGGPKLPTIEIAGFTGLATFIALSLDMDSAAERIQVTSENSRTNVFLEGVEGNQSGYHARLSSGGVVNFCNGKLYNNGDFPIPEQCETRSADWVRIMLKQLRSTKPAAVTNLGSGVTDVRLYRVNIAYPNVGIHVKSGGQVPDSRRTSVSTVLEPENGARR